MPEYRAYFIGEGGRFDKAVALVSTDDIEAIGKAKALVTVMTLNFGSATAR